MAQATHFRQTGSTAEGRALLHAALLQDIKTITLDERAARNHLPSLLHSDSLVSGSVEYLRAIFEALKIDEPENFSYPAELEPWLRRKVWRAPAGHACLLKQPVFVKPVKTKVFTGFVLDPALWTDSTPSKTANTPSLSQRGDARSSPEKWQPACPAERMELAIAEADSEHVRSQFCSLMNLPANEPAWFSEVIELLSEWRFYVQGGELLGYARYDLHGSDEAPMPQVPEVIKAIARFQAGQKAPAAYALDFGVDREGRTVLVEANDAWALGLYPDALTPRQYWAFCQARWRELVQSSALKS